MGISLPLDYDDLDPAFVRAHTGPALFGLLDPVPLPRKRGSLVLLKGRWLANRDHPTCA